MESKIGRDDLTVSHGDNMSLDELRQIITAYEEKYRMSSDEFLCQWQAGTAPDTDETNEWAMLRDAL